MINKYLFSNLKFLPLTLILILVISRLIPHPPNFTPIITIAIMSGYLFKDNYFSIFILVVSMLIGDFFIGFYDNMLFVYLPLILITVIFSKIKMKINYRNLFLYGFIGSLIFFVISNFGVWLIGDLYTKNIGGLIECYFMAIPFFKNTIISTLLFSYIAFFSNNYLGELSQKLFRRS